MKKLTMKKIGALALAAGLAVSVCNLLPISALQGEAAGKVAVAPYIQYTFDDASTMFENSGTSAADSTKDYTLQKLGNATPENMCYWQDLELKDNGALYLDGANNPFANGDLTDFTIAIDVTARYSSWYGSVLSWDGIQGDADNGSYANHKYMRVSSAWKGTDADWLRFMENQAYEEYHNFAHWESYGKGAKLFTGDRQVSETNPITLLISVDKDNKIVAKSFEGVNAKETVTRDLVDKNWDIYSGADATQKRFTIGGAYDSRDKQHLQMKFNGRLDNVRIYDFAMSEEQMTSYGESQERQLMVDGVEIDTNIVGGTVTVDKDRPEVGQTVTLTPVPDANAELVQITVNGEVIEPVAGVYTATMVEGGLFVSAQYIRSFGVSVDTAITNGAVVADKTNAKEGEIVTFTVTPNSGYQVKKVLVNGAPIEAVNGVYSTIMPSEELVVSAEFAKWLKITVQSGGDKGTVSVNKTECWENDSVIINAKANEGYEISKVLVNGEEVQKTGIVYKFTATQDSEVCVEFKKLGASGGGCGSTIISAGAGLSVLGAAAFLALRKKRK